MRELGTQVNTTVGVGIVVEDGVAENLSVADNSGVLSNLCDVLRDAKDPRLAAYLKHAYDRTSDSDEKESLAEELATLGAAVIPTTPPMGAGSQAAPKAITTPRPSILNNLLWLAGTVALLFLPLGRLWSVVPAVIAVQLVLLIIKFKQNRG